MSKDEPSAKAGGWTTVVMVQTSENYDWNKNTRCRIVIDEIYLIDNVVDMIWSKLICRRGLLVQR